MQRHLRGAGVSAPPERPAGRWQGVLTSMRVLAPADDALDLEAFLDPRRPAGAEPFSAARMETLARLSSAVLADPVLRQDPASVAVAYWLRRSQVSRLAQQYAHRVAEEPDIVRVPVGRVLHMAPGNVDTLFIYSWTIAYLCGNVSVVRLSQDTGIVVQALLRAIDAVAVDEPSCERRTAFSPTGTTRPSQRRCPRGVLIASSGVGTTPSPPFVPCRCRRTPASGCSAASTPSR
jgi:Acyl-CoA reductase (LuxC).